MTQAEKKSTTQTSNHHTKKQYGLSAHTGTRAGTETADKEAICEGCIKGFVAAMAEGVGLTVNKT